MKQPIRKILLCISLLALFGPLLLTAQETRTGEIAWARLKTDYKYWDRHANSEAIIIEFIDDHTDLAISREWQVADIDDLETMTPHPFLYAEAIHPILSEAHRENLKEYLLRGGFLFIDACINPEVNPDPDVFLWGQIEVIKAILPEATFHRFSENSAIFENFFVMEEGLPRTYYRRIYDDRWSKHGLYVFHYENRPIAIVSLSGLKCGWTFHHGDQHHINCCQQMVNTYIWALTQ